MLRIRRCWQRKANLWFSTWIQRRKILIVWKSRDQILKSYRSSFRTEKQSAKFIKILLW
ncbi:hypothetical protein X975_06487, partial [Stegodyphus mimosarum]